MNYEATERILEKLKPYVDIENLEISTESTDWRGRKYKADYVKLEEKHNVGFEVTDRSIIVFFFTDHQHFDNYSTDENDTDYIGWAMEFLENLFILPVRHIEKYKGKKMINEKYYFIKDGQDDYFGGTWYGLVRAFNPFAKKADKNTMWKYDVNTKAFVDIGDIM